MKANFFDSSLVLWHETWLHFENGWKHFLALQEFLNAKFALYFWKCGNFFQVSGVVEETPYKALLIDYLVKYIYVWEKEIKCSVKAHLQQYDFKVAWLLFNFFLCFQQLHVFLGRTGNLCPTRTLFIVLFTLNHWPKCYLAYPYQHNYEGKTVRLCMFSCALLVKL